MDQRTVEGATARDKVHLWLKGLQMEDIQRGMILAKPRTINPYLIFCAILYVFEKKDGCDDSPFSAGYKIAQFRRRTINENEKVTVIMNDKVEEIKMIMFGDYACIVIQLMKQLLVSWA
ncbi:hypothetical protein V6N11_057088 [Hibiscus sabdariffa]|uniref:Translation elongation factor EFTu/EF1A C-terminal domain-containing protein n=1 Tax=Hibiscus sabdariffa TaxID=183260 RepID=A0ABR1ZVV2_9ROSI